MELADDVMGGFKLAKVFHDCSSPITDLEFSADGESCLAASSQDESIHLYDALLGKYPLCPHHICSSDLGM